MSESVVHFVFSDEVGSYKKDRGDNFLSSHPYYCRVALGISAPDWIQLRDEFTSLRGSLDVPSNAEVKWSHIWSAISNWKRGQQVDPGKSYGYLAGQSEEELLDYLESAFKLLANTESLWAVFTWTDNSESSLSVPRETLLKWHLQELMQRAEMELQPRSSLGVLLLDVTDDSVDDELRSAYSSIYRDGDFIDDYRHIKDSVGFEVSHQSFGMMLADYAVGAFNGWLRGFDESMEWVDQYIWPILRKDPNGRPEGRGIREVPSSDTKREWLTERIDDLRATPDDPLGAELLADDDLPF